MIFQDAIENCNDVVKLLVWAANHPSTWSRGDFIASCIGEFENEDFICEFFVHRSIDVDNVFAQFFLTDDYDQEFVILVTIQTYLTANASYFYVHLSSIFLLLRD